MENQADQNLDYFAQENVQNSQIQNPFDKVQTLTRLLSRQSTGQLNSKHRASIGLYSNASDIMREAMEKLDSSDEEISL